MAKSFTKKCLRVDVVLGEGTFDGEHNSKSFEGLETSVSIEKPGLPDKNTAKVTIIGMSLDDMRQLTMLAFKPLQSQKNVISIFAGDAEQGMEQCFLGEITAAHADFQSAPTIKMNIEAAAGAYASLKAESPVAVKGSQTAASLIEQFAKDSGYAFENKGVNSSVKNAVFNGSPTEKAYAVARQVGAELIIDDGKFILLPFDKGRQEEGNAVLLTPETGMLGYPSFSNDGVSVTCLYNPALELGGMVKIESIVPGATGVWKIVKLSHELNAYGRQGGAWFSQVDASPIDGGGTEGESGNG